MMGFHQRRSLHDQQLEYLVKNNYAFFRCPIYPVDQELAPLRDLSKQALSPEEWDARWNTALIGNPFWNDLLNQFGGQAINHLTFLQKIGDFVLDINGIWHVIDLKTSDRTSSIYYVNFDSFVALRMIPWELRRNAHILFYNDAYKTYYIGPFRELKFDTCYYHYPELTDERRSEVENYLVNHIPTVNHSECDDDMDRTSNVYLSIDINSEFNRQYIFQLHDYISRLKTFQNPFIGSF